MTGGVVSHFSWPIDGSIVGFYLVATLVVGMFVRRYCGKVEHFLVAGREVNVFLGIASLAATEFGVITCMYSAELGHKYGFAGATPGILMALAMLLVGLTGFCIKPLREAGVVTVPELFENRFGPRIRWATAVVIALAGLLNMGIFLRITGEFLVLLCGIDLKYLEIMMTALLAMTVIYTVTGGMLSVLVTEFLQFLVVSFGLIAVTVLILTTVGWGRLTGAVMEHHAAGGFNPLVNAELGWPFVLFNGLSMTAAVLTRQTIVSRILAAKDSRTSRRIYIHTSFFFTCRVLIPGIWGIAALAWLSPTALDGLTAGLQQKTSLYAMPVFLSRFVPVGLIGLLLAAMLSAVMGSTAAYMITWGSVIYNDILAPFRKTQWTEKRGLRWNRTIIVLIGLFLLFYGLWYPLKGDVWAYLLVTGAIALTSTSTLLIACCYWKRANNWGAAGAIVGGATVPILYLVIQQIPATTGLAEMIGPYYSGIAAYLVAGIAMVVGSLLKPNDEEQAAVESPLIGRAEGEQ